MLEQGDKIGLVGCSNGQPVANLEKVKNLVQILEGMGLEVVCSPYLFQVENVFSGTGKQRAEALMDFYRADEIKAIFDISGGDLANEVLSEINFEVIATHPKPFWGYSDLTTVINAIYTRTQLPSFLYQIRNLVGDDAIEQISRFKNSMLEGQKDLFDVSFKFLQGESLSGIVIGGNIRCLLKLAGTPYMPPFKDRILFLESYGGSVAQMVTYLNQLKQMGAFREVKGILLGTFSQMEAEGAQPSIEQLVMDVVDNKNLPIAKTSEVGHGSDAKCLIIGHEIRL